MLVTLEEILKKAKEQKYAVGAFNTPNLEAIIAVIRSAEELQVPVIIQHAEVHESLIPIEVIGPVMIEFAKRATIPVCVHLDHGTSFEMCMKAIRLGFTSIMYDASGKSFEENMSETKEVVRIAHAAGVSVEAELGHVFTSAIGGGEGRGAVGASDYASLEDAYTNPETAKQFVEETGVDALAIAFGTTHGVYTVKPVLDLDRITAIKNKIDIPFVMHGGSGVPEEGFKTAIQNGITKINYYTYMAMAGAKAVTDQIKNTKEGEATFFHDMSLASIEGMKDNVMEALKIFCHK